jgi:NADH:ubiquinone oxidoreductase subunit K
MAPGILYIKYPGLIIPVRFTISIAILFIGIKANVVAFYEQQDWRDYPAHVFLLVTAIVNTTLAGLSIVLAFIREDEKLPAEIRWRCAVWGILFRAMLFALTIVSVIVIAGYMQPHMSLWYIWIISEAALSSLL